jgi:hypothetical protein
MTFNTHPVGSVSRTMSFWSSINLSYLRPPNELDVLHAD